MLAATCSPQQSSINPTALDKACGGVTCRAGDKGAGAGLSRC